MYVALRSAMHDRGVDYLTAADAGNRGRSDDWQLEFAHAERRVLLSANKSDFSRIHWERLARGTHHSGIIVLTQQRVPIGMLVAKLTRLQSVRDSASFVDQLFYINTDPEQEV